MGLFSLVTTPVNYGLSTAYRALGLPADDGAPSSEPSASSPLQPPQQQQQQTGGHESYGAIIPTTTSESTSTLKVDIPGGGAGPSSSAAASSAAGPGAGSGGPGDGRVDAEVQVGEEDVGAGMGVDMGSGSEQSWSEDEEDEVLVDTPYKHLLCLHLLTPLFVALYIGITASVLIFAAPLPHPPHAHHPPYHRPQLVSFLVGASAWLTSWTTRTPSYLLGQALLGAEHPTRVTVLSAVLHGFAQEAVRWGALVVGVRGLGVGERSPHQRQFGEVLWVGLGWASVAMAFATWQQLENLTLYRDLLPTTSRPSLLPARAPSPQHPPLTSLDYQLSLLSSLRARRSLTALFGLPFPNIPFFTFPLWRLDALLLSLGLSLLLGARPNPLVWAAVGALHTAVTLGWRFGVRRVGLGGASWASLMVALGALFLGLGQWGALR